MKLGCLEICTNVSNSNSLVSPRAGATISLGVVGPFDGSVVSTGPRCGEREEVDPDRCDPVPFELFADDWVFNEDGGGASLSIVNVKNNSC